MYSNNQRSAGSRSGSSKKRRKGVPTWLLAVIFAVLAVAVVAVVLIIIDGKNRSNDPGGDPAIIDPTNTGRPTSEPGGDPGADVPEGLVVSEVVRGDHGFAEIFNNSDKSVDLGNFWLSDNPNKSDKWQFPDEDLEPGAYAVVLFSDSIAPAEAQGYLLFRATFKLNSEENGVYLFSRGGKLADKLVFGAGMPSALAAVRVGDGSAYTAFPTMGARNSDSVFSDLTVRPMDASSPVYINEVLASNKYDITDEDGDRSDWVELYNASAESVRLLGYYLSDDPSNPDKWALPDVTLESGGYLIVFLSGKDRTEAELHTSFKLSSTDEGLFLTCFDGMTQDSVVVPEELAPNISIGRGEDGSILYFPRPTPGAPNTTVGFTEYIGVGGFNPSSVYISEVCAVTPARSHEMDWVELYNGGSSSVTLTGWHLSDSRSDLDKYELSSVSIPAGGYAAVNCSDKLRDAWAKPAPFAISPAGETLYLSDANGVVVDVFESGALRTGVTSGRENGTENGERVFFSKPTKGARNADTCLLSYAAAPAFSETGLYHDSPFTVTLSTRSENGVIHYTLDGSAPTASSTVYAGPISVTGNTVIRALTVVDGLVPSETVTVTYLFEKQHTIPVVTLAMAPADFSEVYAVSKPFVPVVERECMMQYFETDGSLGVEAPAGVRVSGASTRAYAQKSLGIYFRAGYGRSSVTYPFFGADYFTNFGALVLRNAGQDWIGPRIRDSFTSTSVLGMNIDASAASFVAVYINGKYWGLYDLKENMNEEYLATHYGVDPETANIIKRNTMELEGTNTDFLRVRGYVVQNDTVIPLTDERYAQFTQWVDAESIMDYLIARQYFPDADMFNQKYWRTTDYKVRWRAVFFDSDFALASPTGDVLHCYFNVKGVPSANGSLSQMDLYCGLLSNAQWRHDFIVRFIYCTKYYLTTERLLGIYDSMVSTMSPEIGRQIARWGQPKSVSHWQSEIQKLRSYIIDRPGYAKQNLLYVMGISSDQYAVFEKEADALYEAGGRVFQRVFDKGN